MGTGKFAFITGASRGIGRAIAEELAREGWNLSLTCRSHPEALRTAAAALHEKYGVTVLTHTADAGSFEETEKACADTLRAFSRIDAVVNNAGISLVKLASDTAPDEWDRVLRVNLSGAFYTSKCFIPQMVQQKSGRILNISSMWGRSGASMETAYSASKGGLNAFTEALAKELAPSGIAVNAIACGVIDTDMNRIFSEEERADLAAEIPAGRFASPAEAARLAAGILSLPVYMTGQIIGMDGGFL